MKQKNQETGTFSRTNGRPGDVGEQQHVFGSRDE